MQAVPSCHHPSDTGCAHTAAHYCPRTDAHIRHCSEQLSNMASSPATNHRAPRHVTHHDRRRTRHNTFITPRPQRSLLNYTTLASTRFVQHFQPLSLLLSFNCCRSSARFSSLFSLSSLDRHVRYVRQAGGRDGGYDAQARPGRQPGRQHGRQHGRQPAGRHGRYGRQHGWR